MSTRRLPSVLWARRGLVAFVVATVLAVSAVAAFIAPVSFTSRALVEVRPKDAATDLRSAYYGGRVVADQSTPYVELFHDGAVLDGVVTRLGPAASTDEDAIRGLSATTVVETDRITVAIDVVSDRWAQSVRVAEAAASTFADLARRQDPDRPRDVIDVVALVGTPISAPARIVPTAPVVIMLIGSVSAAVLGVVAALLAERRSTVRLLSSKEERT